MRSSQVAARLAGDGHATIAPVMVKTRLVAVASNSRMQTHLRDITRDGVTGEETGHRPRRAAR
jgi:hypothetical protein